jgi:hypothetical protein
MMPPFSVSGVATNNYNVPEGVSADNIPNKAPLRRERRKRAMDPKPETSTKRKVNFKRRVEVKKIRSRKTISEEERQAVYWTRKEFIAIRMNLISELQQLLANEISGKQQEDDDESCCARGLENQTRSGQQARKANKKLIRKIVMEEQALQKDEGVSDPDSIAFLCMLHALDAVEAAIEVGKKDAMSAQLYAL